MEEELKGEGKYITPAFAGVIYYYTFQFLLSVAISYN
jgi:hypothetical protein